MRRLNKQPEPQVLVDNGAAWRDEYLAALAAGEVPNAIKYRYRHAEIRSALRVETSKKCAYCESKIAPIAPDHVEHILSKSARPELIVEWSNLTLACPTCNGLKGDYYSDAEPLINPYVEDPEEHLLHFGPFVLTRPGSAMGERTARRLQLSRVGLIERKAERIGLLEHLVARWHEQTEPELRNLLEGEIRQEAASDAEYSATVRAYLLAAGFPL